MSRFFRKRFYFIRHLNVEQVLFKTFWICKFHYRQYRCVDFFQKLRLCILVITFSRLEMFVYPLLPTLPYKKVLLLYQPLTWKFWLTFCENYFTYSTNTERIRNRWQISKQVTISCGDTAIFIFPLSRDRHQVATGIIDKKWIPWPNITRRERKANKITYQSPFFNPQHHFPGVFRAQASIRIDSGMCWLGHLLSSLLDTAKLATRPEGSKLPIISN